MRTGLHGGARPQSFDGVMGMVDNRFAEINRRATMVRALERRPCATDKLGCPKDGRMAHQRRFRLVDNPHPAGTPEFARWRADWLNQQEDDRA